MFDLGRLVYAGRNGGIDTFYYEGVRIDAAFSRAQDGQYLFVGMGDALPEAVQDGLLAWFGIDRRRYYAEYEFSDRSCYYVQRTAA